VPKYQVVEEVDSEECVMPTSADVLGDARLLFTRCGAKEKFEFLLAIADEFKDQDLPEIEAEILITQRRLNSLYFVEDAINIRQQKPKSTPDGDFAKVVASLELGEPVKHDEQAVSELVYSTRVSLVEFLDKLSRPATSKEVFAALGPERQALYDEVLNCDWFNRTGQGIYATAKARQIVL
jgi:hypothetical protein